MKKRSTREELKAMNRPPSKKRLMASAVSMSIMVCASAAQAADAPAVSSSENADYLKGRLYLKGEGGENRRIEEGVALIKRAADAGHPEALGVLGYLYSVGLGVPKDSTLALQCFRLAAEGGSVKAQVNLGLTLAKPGATYSDQAEGLRWIEKAANDGSPDAQAALAQAYFEGNLGPIRKNYAKAADWASKAAKQDNSKASNLLGVAYQYGYGVPKDANAAREQFLKAAAQGDHRAECNLAILTGMQNPATRLEALSWLIRARNGGDSLAIKMFSDLADDCPPELLTQAQLLADKPLQAAH